VNTLDSASSKDEVNCGELIKKDEENESVNVSWLVDVAAVVGMFFFLIAPHEAGHFLFAKLFKVKTPIFALGMGPKLWAKTWGGTEYSLRALPLGGFVSIAGMGKDDLEDPEGFHSKPAWQRFLILVGGPAANLLVAALLVSGLTLGLVNTDPSKIATVVTPSPAYAAGLRPGESLLAVNGQAVKSFADLSRIEAAGSGQPLSLELRRGDGSVYTTTVTPAYDSSRNVYYIGVAPLPTFTLWQAVQAGPRFDVEATGLIIGGIRDLFTSKVAGGPLGPQGFTGPVGIGYATISAAQQGPPIWVLTLAIISVALALTNLLPIPALDGARIVVVLVEAVIRRPLPRKRELLVQQMGLIALLGLMVVLTALDVFRIATGQFPSLH
jgi:regulator of sigma E protease